MVFRFRVFRYNRSVENYFYQLSQCIFLYFGRRFVQVLYENTLLAVCVAIHPEYVKMLSLRKTILYYWICFTILVNVLALMPVFLLFITRLNTSTEIQGVFLLIKCWGFLIVFIIPLIIVKDFVVYEFSILQQQVERVVASTLNLINGCAPVTNTFVFRC